MIWGNDPHTRLLVNCNTDFSNIGIGASEAHNPTVSNIVPTASPITATIDNVNYHTGTGSGKWVRVSQQQVKFAYSPNYDLGAKNFDIQFEARFTANNVQQHLVWQHKDNNNCWVIYYDIVAYAGKNCLRFISWVGGVTKASYISTSVWTPTVNTWYNIHFNRTGTTLTCQIEGVSHALTEVTAISNNNISNGGALYLGYDAYNSGGNKQCFGGNMDDMSIINDGDHILDMPMDSAFSNIAYVGEDTIDTLIYKWIGSGKFITNYGLYVSYPDSVDWDIGSEYPNFTIDMWIRFRHALQQTCFIRQNVASNSRWLLQYISGTLHFYAVGGYLQYSKTCVWTPAIDTWQHIAIVKSGANFYMFIDGDSKAVTNLANDNCFTARAAPLEIGRDVTYANVNIDEVRISDTARWTSSFTVPPYEYGRLKMKAEKTSLRQDSNMKVEYSGALRQVSRIAVEKGGVLHEMNYD